MASGLLCLSIVRASLVLALVIASSSPALAAGKGGRVQRLRDNARFFTKITVKGDWSGEHVVHHDALTTAFLDRSDPAHPRYHAGVVDEDEAIARIPVGRRAHLLVVPNVPREHIGKSLSGTITLDDLDATRAVFATAHALADRLGLRNARIYANTSDRLTVGYLHVHVVGERSGTPYPRLTTP